MDKPFRPMLASKADISILKFPLLLSAKLDGIRASVHDGKPMSRSMKVIRNRHIQTVFRNSFASRTSGLDGELIVGLPTDPDVYRRTDSEVMRFEGDPDFTYWVFDRWNQPDVGYMARMEAIHDIVQGIPWIKVLPSVVVHDQDEVDFYEALYLEHGYEGCMLRRPDGIYKQGRATARGGELLKIKRYEDAEAVIIGAEERMHNANEAQKDERGYTKRTAHKENQIGTNALGAFVCKGLTFFEGGTFSVGTGYTDHERLAFWSRRDELIGKIIKFKYFAVGVKDAPRHPVFLGFRDSTDMTPA